MIFAIYDNKDSCSCCIKVKLDGIIPWSLGAKQNPDGVSVDGVTVSASHFARRYGRRLSIVIARSI